MNYRIKLKHAYSEEDKKQDHFEHFDSLGQKMIEESSKMSKLIQGKMIIAENQFSKPCSKMYKMSLNNTPPEIVQKRLSFKELPPNLFDYIQENRKDSKLQSLSQSPSKKGRIEKARQAHLNIVQSIKKMQEQRCKKQNQKKKNTLNELQKLKMGEMKKKGSLQQRRQQKKLDYKQQKKEEKLIRTVSTNSSAKNLFNKRELTNKQPSISLKDTKDSCKRENFKIDDFDVLSLLEKGQFGTVYLVRHKLSKFICALKKIPKEIFQGQQAFIQQLVRQIKIQSFLDHPNIVQLYGFFTDQENFYILLELCSSGNIYQSLKKTGRFTEEKVRSVMRQVSHSIQFMHDCDIIHRDIKPQNILMHEGVAKVCDFGWSINSPLMRDTRCGTPLYSSPEIIKNEHYDNKVDIWNLGVLAYELLYGRVPFEIRSEEDLIKIVDEEIYFSKSVKISEEAEEFILKCLTKNPKDRFTMVKLMDHQFIRK